MQKILYSLCISTLIFLGFNSTTNAQCAGNCGVPSVGNCGCDSDCWLYGDCCPDIESACPEIRPTEPVYPPIGGGGTVTPLACNPAASICTPGQAGPFNFDQNTPGPPNDFANPVGCSTGLFGNPGGFGFIILNITGSGALNLLVDGSANSGFIDVVVYNIPPGVAPCTAVMNSANEIGCNYAPAAVGCTQFGNSIAGCGSSVPAPSVTAGQQLMVIVHDYSTQSSSFTLQLGPGGATTGPPNATINVPTNTICANGPSFMLTAVNSGGTWSGPGMSPTGSFNPVAAGAGTHTISYTVGTAPCVSSSTAQLTVAAPPVGAFSTNTPVCVGQTISLTAVAGPPGATYHWTGPGGFTATGINPTRPNATVAMSGNYNMYMVANGCTSATVTQPFVVNPTGPAPTISSNTPICHGNPVIMDGPTEAGAQYFWTGPNGWVDAVEDPTIPVSDYTTAGDYSLYMISANGCTTAVSTQTIVISVPPKPTITPIVPQCFGGAGSNLVSDLPNGTYAGTGITDPISGYFDPAVAGSGTHQIIYTIPEPCGSADTLDIIVSYPVAIQGTVVNETCPQVGDGSIDITTTTAPGYTLQYLWSNNATTEDADSIVLGNYTVVVTDQYGCDYTESFVVGAGNSLSFSYTPNHVLCNGDPTGSIVVNPTSGTPPYFYTVNGFQTSANPIQNLGAGMYNVIITDSKGCDTVFTTQINEPPLLTADSTYHQIRLGDHLTLSPTMGGGTGNTVLSWFPNYNLSCDDCPFPMAWPERTTVYTLNIIDENGCEVAGKVIVDVFHDGPFIPNSFTPGKDDLNNMWLISDYGVQNFEVIVFDRWGSKVFESDDIYEGWDGKLKNGNYYEGGTYVYKAYIRYLDGKEKTVHGNITLLR